MNEKKLYVRCSDRMAFEIDRNTLEPKRWFGYDPYCFSSPDPTIEYMEYSTWSILLNKQIMLRQQANEIAMLKQIIDANNLQSDIGQLKKASEQ